MICKFSFDNFKAFSKKTELDFYANGNIKRLDYNSINIGNKNILKTIGIYGPNNTGKTCLLSAFFCLRALMLNEKHDNFANAFVDNNNVTSFSIEYYINNKFYVYSVKYDNSLGQYIYESLFLKNYSEKSNSKEMIFERGEDILNWKGINKNIQKANIKSIFSSSFPFMILFNDNDNLDLKEAKSDYIQFANSIQFIKMDEKVDVTKTINLIQNDTKAFRFIKEFVKNCDLHIDDYGFEDNIISDTNIINERMSNFIINPNFNKDSLKFYSKHNGYRVPSIFFDSLGTLKLIALSGYIYDSLNKGKILIIDEIDSSLHHILTKSIVAMFSNILNKKAQLVFATHDILLLDLKELFRKDQIYIVDVDENSSSKISRLSEFTSRSEKGIRGDEHITSYYLKGQFGSIPKPDLFSSLEEAINDE